LAQGVATTVARLFQDRNDADPRGRRSVEVCLPIPAAMKVVLFGATGMVGAGVLRECLRDDRVVK
jgi:hypothetical protein